MFPTVLERPTCPLSTVDTVKLCRSSISFRGHDVRTEAEEGIEALCPCCVELIPLEDVVSGHVEKRHVTKHHPMRVLLFQVPASLPDDHTQLCFGGHSLRFWRQDDGISIADDRRPRLQEGDGLGRYGQVEVSRMVPIIESDAQYLWWIVVGCTKPNPVGPLPEVSAVLRQFVHAVFQTGERIVGLLNQRAQTARQTVLKREFISVNVTIFSPKTAAPSSSPSSSTVQRRILFHRKHSRFS